MGNIAKEFKKRFPDKCTEVHYKWTKEDKENWEAVQKYIQMVEDGHKNAGKGHLMFGKLPIIIKTRFEAVV